MKQYEIRWAHLPEPIGKRPVLLLTRTPAYEYLTAVIVAEITNTIRNIPQEVRLSRAEGLRRACVANLDNVHVVRKELLRERVGAVAPDRHVEIKRAMGHALSWDELKVL